MPTHPEGKAEGRPHSGCLGAERGPPRSTFNSSSCAMLWPKHDPAQQARSPREPDQVATTPSGDTGKSGWKAGPLRLTSRGPKAERWPAPASMGCPHPHFRPLGRPASPEVRAPQGPTYRSLSSSFRLSSRSRRTTSQTCWASSSVSLERSSFFPISASRHSHTWNVTDGSGQLTHGARPSTEGTDVLGSLSCPG